MIRRRSLLGAGATSLVALAGCDDDPAATRRSSPSPTPSADPDEALLDDAVGAIQAALRQVQEAGHSPVLKRFARLHRAHLRALEAQPDPTAAPAASGGVRLVELRLQRHLAALAGQAESGPLARLLASMSAGIAAHLAATPRKGGARF